MITLPFYIPVVFILTTFLTVFIFYKASGKDRIFLTAALAWMAVQGLIAATGFFSKTDVLPPRFLFVIVLPLITMVIIFSTAKGRQFTGRFDIAMLTLLHSIRIVVEAVLFWLFLNKAMPQLMTFEGRNFDILSGLSAPVVAWLGYHKQKLGKAVLLSWNIVCLALLINIVVNAILAAPLPFQQFAFDQPNIAVLYFPFIWLPGFIVPAVLLTHLANIRLLWKKEFKGNISFRENARLEVPGLK